MVNKYILSSVMALGFAASASAAPLYNVSVFDYESWMDNASGASAIETFEQRGDDDVFAFENTSQTSRGGHVISGGAFDGKRYGELSSRGYSSAQVGLFTTLGNATGTGSTCSTFDLNGDNCSDVALQFDPAVNGQGNTAPVFVDKGSAFAGTGFDENGLWALSSNDTAGINWIASLSGGGMFNSLFFILRDAGDAGDQTLDIATTISVGGNDRTTRFTDSRLSNNNRMLVQIDFLEAVSSANIAIMTSRNDGFTIDGVGISAVPLPASALLLMGGLGGLLVMKRRRKAA